MPIAGPVEGAAAPPNLAQPPPAGQPAAAGQPGMRVGQDKDWNTIAFNVDMAALDKEFTRCKIPRLAAPAAGGFAAGGFVDPNQRDEYVTQFLRVWLTRQEQNTAGQWVSETYIPLTPRLEAVPVPDKCTTPPEVQKAYEYMQWAAANAGFIFQPAFPEVTAGDPWYYPGQPKPLAAPGVRPPGFAPPPPPPAAPGPRPLPPVNPFGKPRTGYYYGGGAGFDT